MVEAKKARKKKKAAPRPDAAPGSNQLFRELGSKGMVLLQEGKKDEAVDVLASAVAAAPDLPEAADILYNRAGALKDLGRHTEAVADLEKVVKLKPDDAGAWGMKAGMLKKPLGRREEALSDYDRAISLHKKQGLEQVKSMRNHYYNQGNLLMHFKRIPEAIQSFDAAIAIDPLFSQAIANRAVCLKNEGRSEEADEGFATAQSINPEHVKMETTDMTGDDLSKSQFGNRITTSQTTVNRDTPSKKSRQKAEL